MMPFRHPRTPASRATCVCVDPRNDANAKREKSAVTLFFSLRRLWKCRRKYAKVVGASDADTRRAMLCVGKVGGKLRKVGR